MDKVITIWIFKSPLFLVTLRSMTTALEGGISVVWVGGEEVDATQERKK